MGNKKKKKYTRWIGESDLFDFSYTPEPNSSNKEDDDSIPAELLLDLHRTPGFFLGLKDCDEPSQYVGIPQGTEWNAVVVGGCGSGKSSGVAKPSLGTFRGAICATDIKGELSDFYMSLYQRGIVTRPYIIFDPTQPDGIGYDPFYHLLHDDENLVNNIWDIVTAIHPLPADAREPFWVKTEQAILAAALLYYFRLGSSFSETISNILSSNIKSLCEKVRRSNDVLAMMFLGEVADMEIEQQAAFDRGLQNVLIQFNADPFISNAFRGEREKATYFTWDDLDDCNIFLRIPAEKITQWSGAITLMYSQLIRYLERRPDKYTAEGANNIQTLLLMDEIARFGKLEMLPDAIATLRSKSVNICLVIQSLAQLDKLFGVYDRRIILDNCKYKIILSADDAETQQYLSDLIGKHKGIQRSVSEHLDEFMDETGYSREISESWEYRVQPQELSTLKDVLLLTPYGFCRAEKVELHNNELNQMQFPVIPEIPVIYAEATVLEDTEATEDASDIIWAEPVAVEAVQ